VTDEALDIGMTQPENSSQSTTDSAGKFFLFIGGTTSDAATSILKTSGIYYRQKMLQSTPENWEEITSLLKDPNLVGAVGKLTNRQFEPLLSPTYLKVGKELFASLGVVEHILFIHQALLTGEDPSEESPPDPEDETYIDFLVQADYFSPPKDKVRKKVLGLLEDCGVNIVPYETNAELSVLAAAFIEDHERNLLFRIYVPAGRIYAAEVDKLLTMFRDWLTQATTYRVRQDGYATAKGRVYEFFGDDQLDMAELDRQFETFTEFLVLCESDARRAENWLLAQRVPESVAKDMVRRYAKESKRLTLDLRHESEARLLSLRQRFESELVDSEEPGDQKARDADEILGDLVPTNLLTADVAARPGSSTPQPGGLVVYQQNFLGSVENVIQDLRGSSDFSQEAKDLLGLIQKFGDKEAASLESDLHEIEDEDARTPDRLAARQRLKRFVFKLGGKVEDATLAVLLKYVQTKIGI